MWNRFIFLVDLLAIFFRTSHLLFFWYLACRSLWVGGLFFSFVLVLFLSLAVPLCFSLYLINPRFVFRAEGAHQSVKLVPPSPPDGSPLWRVLHTFHSCPHPLICGEFVKQFDYAFFHVVFQMYIIVLVVICNSIFF